MTINIKLPSIIDDGRLDWAFSLLHESRNIRKPREEIRIDWSAVQEISPAGYAILCCLFDSFVEQRNKIKCVFCKKIFHNAPVIQNLMDTGKFPSLPSPDIHNMETTDTILKGETSIDILFQERFREKFASLLSEELAFDCLLILNELMQNSFDHSTAERYYIYAGMWKNEFHAGVLDMGISIPAKMEQRYTCNDDLEYLELALKEGTSTRRTRTGGVGLAYFFHFLKRNGGKLTIISRDAQVRRYFKTRRSQKNMLKHTLHGTWCFARFTLGS